MNASILIQSGDVYSLNKKFISELDNFQNEINSILERIIGQFFEIGKWPENIIHQVSQRLIYILGKILEKYGEHYAYLVTGGELDGFPISYDEIKKICEKEIEDDLSKYISSKDIFNTIKSIFSSDDSTMKRFVFCVTQNYYFLRLLGN